MPSVFLVVPNTASFLHKLWRNRQRSAIGGGHSHIAREIHWNRPHLDCLPVATGWIDCVFQHKGAKFFLNSWPSEQTKELVVLSFLSQMCQKKGLSAPYNIVTFLDFDSDHANARIQNVIRETGRIARCYHLDSLNNDCLQCCDLLLGATISMQTDPTVRLSFPDLRAKRERNEKLRDSEVKRYIAGYLAEKVDVDGTAVYDYRIKTVNVGEETPITKSR